MDYAKGVSAIAVHLFVQTVFNQPGVYFVTDTNASIIISSKNFDAFERCVILFLYLRAV